MYKIIIYSSKYDFFNKINRIFCYYEAKEYGQESYSLIDSKIVGIDNSTILIGILTNMWYAKSQYIPKYVLLNNRTALVT